MGWLVEKLKVLAAALALQDFTIDELSGLSGVNPSTVRNVLKRNPTLIQRASQPSDHATAGLRRSRGRPSKRWVVADGAEIRRLIDETGALPKFEPNYANMEAGDWREAAVAVAEDALAQVGDQSDAVLQERLLGSARSSLFFAENDTSISGKIPWWQDEDSPFAVRARAVDTLATLASLPTTQRTPNVLRDTATRLAEAMQVAPDRGEATYFVPFSQILAQSGEFAPMYAVCAREEEPVYPLADEWTEVVMPDFHAAVGHIVTQVWAKPLVNVSTSMPVVVSSKKLDAEVSQMIDGIKTMPRPAAVFGSAFKRTLIKKSSWVGASFVPVGEPNYSRQDAIDSVVALIDRFSTRR
jgi:hypothetical protein